MMILSQNETVCVSFEKGIVYVSPSFQIKWADNLEEKIESAITLGRYSSKIYATNTLRNMIIAYNSNQKIYIMPTVSEFEKVEDYENFKNQEKKN